MKTAAMFVILSLFTARQSATSQFTWQKCPENPVLRYWTGGVDDPSGYKWVMDPTPLVDEDGVFHMWFTSEAYGYGTSFCVSEAISTDMVHWYAYFKNPVLGPGVQGSFDERGVRVMTVIRDSLGYKMYYQGITPSDNQAIGLATSADRIVWTRYPGNPVLNVGSLGSWDERMISTASVYVDGSGYSMWYTGRGVREGSIGLATSPDGIHWTKHSENPLLVPGPPGSWEQNSAEGAKVIKVDSVFHMFYDGHDPVLSAFQIGYATSRDGVHWTKYSGNPVLTRGSASEWDGQSLGLQGVLFRDNKFHLWYNGLRVNSTYWQIGYATSDLEPLAAPSQGIRPAEFHLSQNYPNPFNPSTTIGYGVPRRSAVLLTVFNVLGQDVATLVEGQQEAGYYNVKFDASGLSSGVYFYRLTAGDYVAVKKFLLLR